MKTKKVTLIGTVCVLLLAAGVFQFFSDGPDHFIEREISAPSVQKLRLAAARGDSWALSPASAAVEYLEAGESERSEAQDLHVSVSSHTGETAVVIVIVDARDDSVYRIYNRLTLRRESGAWIPVQHQTAWQGRGRIGWTTKPTM